MEGAKLDESLGMESGKRLGVWSELSQAVARFVFGRYRHDSLLRREPRREVERWRQSSALDIFDTSTLGPLVSGDEEQREQTPT